MNLTIFQDFNRIDNDSVVFTGDTGRQLCSRYSLRSAEGSCGSSHPILGTAKRCNTEIVLGELDGAIYCGKVKKADLASGEVVFQVSYLRDSPALLPVEIVLAIPRPIMLNRILQFVASCGVSRVLLVRSSNTQKSYAQSSLLSEGEIRKSCLAGLEQGMLTRLPDVKVYASFREFELLHPAVPISAEVCDVLRDFNVDTPKTVALLASPSASATMWQRVRRLGRAIHVPHTAGCRRVLFSISIGPEAGWSPQERIAFADLGYQEFSLFPESVGRERVLRVETAVVAALGQFLVCYEACNERTK